MSRPFVVDTEQLSGLQWSFLPPMRTQREGCAAVNVGTDMIAVVGGYHVEQKFVKSCAAFHAGQWKNLPDMAENRMGCGACSFGRSIVVVGGYRKGRTYIDTAEMFDTTSLQWTSLPSMSIPRAGCACVALEDGIVVVMGGWKDADTAVDTVEQLNVSTGKWTSLPTMLMARAGCAAVCVEKNNIVVMGGYSNYGSCLSSAEVFDVSTQTWSVLPSMNEQRDASAACAVGKCVIVIGGGKSSLKPIGTVEFLNMDAPMAGWSKLPSLKCPRFGCGAAVMGNQVIVLGGRSVGGQHLDSVETVTLPLFDDRKVTEQQNQKAMPPSEKKAIIPKQDPSPANPLPEEWKRMVDSTLKMVELVMKKDKARTNEIYDKAKLQTMDDCDYKVKEVERRLKELLLERRRLLRDKDMALRRRDGKLLEVEEQRRQALAGIETQCRPLIARAKNSSAPEYFVGDEPSSKSEEDVAPSAAQEERAEEEEAEEEEEEKEPPLELTCCITGTLMREPVTAVDGHTYERAAIESWFKRFKLGEKPTSPMTNEKLPSRRLIPSHNVRSQCRSWAQKHGLEDESSVLEVSSCKEPRNVLSSNSRQPRSTGASSSTANHSRHSSSRSVFSVRSSPSSTAGRRHPTEPPSPLGRSFTLFGRSAHNVTHRASR